jgi:hypothetical protein
VAKVIGDPKLKNAQGKWVVNRTCGQCGKPWTRRACGPTHAIIKAEIAHGDTVLREDG